MGLCVLDVQSMRKTPPQPGTSNTKQNDIFGKVGLNRDVNKFMQDAEEEFRKKMDRIGFGNDFGKIANQNNVERQNFKMEIVDGLNLNQFGKNNANPDEGVTRIVERKVVKNGVVSYERVKMVNGKVVEETGSKGGAPAKEDPVQRYVDLAKNMDHKYGLGGAQPKANDVKPAVQNNPQEVKPTAQNIGQDVKPTNKIPAYTPYYNNPTLEKKPTVDRTEPKKETPVGVIDLKPKDYGAYNKPTAQEPIKKPADLTAYNKYEPAKKSPDVRLDVNPTKNQPTAKVDTAPKYTGVGGPSSGTTDKKFNFDQGKVDAPKPNVIPERKPAVVNPPVQEVKKQEPQVPVAKKENINDILNKQGQMRKPAPGKPILNMKPAPQYPERNKAPTIPNTGDVPKFYTKSPVAPPGFIPLNVKWELGPVKEYCQRNGRMDLYAHLKTLLFKASAILRMYVFIPETAPRRVVVPSGNVCPEYKVPQDKLYDAHLVMLSRIYDANQEEETTIAKSVSCKHDTDQRAIIGRIAFNSQKMILPEHSQTMQYDYLNTIVHETIHTLAFHSTNKELIVNRDVKPEKKHLLKIKKINPEIYLDGHWSEAFVPTDLMTPISRSGSVMTIFSLEMIEQRSPGYITSVKKLPNDLFFDDVNDVDAFFKYRCSEGDARSKYRFFCSKRQVDDNFSGCSMDYTYVSKCSSTRLDNNCFRMFGVTEYNCLDDTADEKYVAEFEHRGVDSRCFESPNMGRGLCLKYKVKTSSVTVIVGTDTYECTRSGEEIQLRYTYENGNYNDIKLKCPDIQSFIKYATKTTCPNDCNKNGFCSNGKCICFDGYDAGTNCATDSAVTTNDNLFSEASGIMLEVKTAGT